MSDSFLDKYVQRGASPIITDPIEPDEIDDLGCFGSLRGVRERAVMLELRTKDGRVLAIGYSWIERILYDPSVGITIHAGTTVVRITGRNLGGHDSISLLRGLVAHKVPWIQELDASNLLIVKDGVPTVQGVEW